MYKIIFISIFTLFTDSLFAQSGKKNNKTQRALTASQTNPTALAVEDKVSKIKSPEERQKQLLPSAATVPYAVIDMESLSKSVPNVMPKPSHLKLASDHPIEVKKPEAPKNLPKPSNQGQ